MPSVKRRAAVIALLIYLCLDLSLPSMPGAFVFDVGASVESTQDARPRVTAQPDPAIRPPSNVASVPSRSDLDRTIWRRPQTVGKLSRAPVVSRPRASLPAAPALEEPH
jgi:hypothetical protein